MKPRLLVPMYLGALLLAGHFPAVLKSAEDAKAVSPAIVLQVKSIDELLVSLNSAVKTFLPEPMLKEFEKDVLSKLDVNKIKGIDPKKPVGLYATISDGALQGDFSKSSVVVLVPISDEKAFVDLLGTINLQAEKKGDMYVIGIPNVPVAASLQFRKGYAYICFATAKIDASTLLDPHGLFSAKETAAAALHIRLDRLPDDLRKKYLAIYAQKMEQQIEADHKLRGPAEGPPFLEAVRLQTALRTVRWGVRWVKLLVNDGKELIFRLDLDPKTGVIGSEMTLEPRSGSDLAKSIGELRPTKNDFAGIIGADSAVHVLIQVPLFIGEFKELLVNTTELIGKEAANAPKEIAEAVSEWYKALGRTVKEGNLGFAASMRGPDRNHQFTVVGAFNLKDTAPLEKALKTAVKSAPKEEVDRIHFDAFKVQDINVHEIAVGDLLPPEAQIVFGKSSVYVRLSPNAVFVTFGPQGKEVITEKLTQKLQHQPAPLALAEISGKRILALYKTVGAAPEAFLFIDKLTAAERSTVLAIKVKGGEKLVLRVEIGLPALYVLSPKPSR